MVDAKLLPTEATGNVWVKPMFSSGRPTADMMLMFVIKED